MDRAIEILSLFPSSSLACACLITRLRLFSPFSSRSSLLVFPFCNIVCQERLAWNTKRLSQRNLIVFSSPILACCCCEEILKMFYANLICAFRPAGPELGGLFEQMCFQVCGRAAGCVDDPLSHTFHGAREMGKVFHRYSLTFSQTCRSFHLSSFGNQITQIKLENFSPEFYFLYKLRANNLLSRMRHSTSNAALTSQHRLN